MHQPKMKEAAAGGPPAAARVSLLRAWCALVGLSLRRPVRARQMVWIALGLLACTVTLVGLTTAAGRWTMSHWRWPRGQGLTYAQTLDVLTVAAPPSGQAIVAAWRAGLDVSGLYVFSTALVFSVFLSFLLPLWSLSFAVEAVGSERDEGTLIWLLSRPLPRWAIYLGKFLALLPWNLGLNLGGFGLICLAAGLPGRLAFGLYWPAVLAGSLAFASLFHLMGSCFRRSAVVALAYSFFLETILGNMPGYMKRISIGFYVRCLMLDAAGDFGVPPERPSIFLPVTPETAWAVLGSLTVLLLVVGMAIFARREYVEEG
ncbi:MAG: ABC transporter permease [Gemmataceae bacterium]|nr:ABC transporter permease [Gemmataceae bacterium]MDW8263913.1 ABC transporter permease [Gemmataceae bacterium]